MTRDELSTVIDSASAKGIAVYVRPLRGKGKSISIELIAFNPRVSQGLQAVKQAFKFIAQYGK